MLLTRLFRGTYLSQTAAVRGYPVTRQGTRGLGLALSTHMAIGLTRSGR